MRLRSLADLPGRIRDALRRPPAFRIELTRLGGGYLLVCVLVGGAAMNTGNNGLYLVSSALLGTLAASGFVSRRNVWRVAVSVEPPAELFAGLPTTMGMRLTATPRDENRSLRLAPVDGEGAFVERVPAGRSVRVDVTSSFAERGMRPVPAVEVSSRFPLGLFRKTRIFRPAGELLVFPQLLPIPALPPAGRSSGREVDVATARRGRSPEVHAFRDFLPGDDPRDIHWKQTARQRRTILRERLAEGGGWTTIVLDADAAGGAAHFERCVSAAASLACLLVEQGGALALRTADRRIGPGSGAPQRLAVLGALAVATMPKAGEGADPGIPVAGERIVLASEILS